MDHTPPSLHIQLLGDFRLTDGDGNGIAIQQARQQVLLAYLLIHREAPQSRQRIAFLFWPDTSEAQAQTNLRQLFFHLRRAWPAVDDYVQLEPRSVAWRAATRCEVDLVAFERAVAATQSALGRGEVDAARSAGSKAIDLYRGDLLPAAYDDWLVGERERLRQAYLDLLEQLAILCEHARDLAAAIHYAQRFLRADPLHESVYLQLMRLLALSGDRASALRVFHLCTSTLRRELGVEPGAELQEAYARLLNMPSLPPKAPSDSPSTAAEQLVGRKREWRELQSAWQEAGLGHPACVCIVGEAGVGKSRLADELLNWVREQGIAHARTCAYAAEGALAYAPVTEWLRAEALQNGRQQLAAVWLSEVARLLPELLVERRELAFPEPMTEAWQRQRFYEALARMVMAANQPLLLVFDDLQWCDHETLAWLPYLLRFERHARLLVVATVRPEEVDEQHPLAALLSNLRTAGQLVEITIGPLDAESTAALAAQVAAQPVDADTAQRLYRATEGNPLFIVETVRSGALRQGAPLVDGGDPSAPDKATAFDYALSRRVLDVIQRRISQLSGEARELAELAAVIGRSFSTALLALSSKLSEDALVVALDELWRRRIIREQRANAYDFSHSRISEVAYLGISPMRRSWLHQQVAEALTRLHAAELDLVAGEIAVHYARAGRASLAIDFYHRAVEVAYGRLAYVELSAHLRRMIDLFETLPATAENIERQLEALSRLGGVLIITQGLTAPAVEEVAARARTQSYLVANPDLRFEVLRSLRYYWGQRCRWDVAALLNDELHTLAQTTQNPVHMQVALRLTGAEAFHRGNLQAAAELFAQAVARQEVNQGLSGTHDYEQDQAIANLRRMAGTRWLMGYPDQAQAHMQELMARTRTLARPFDTMMTLDFAFDLAHYLRRPDLAAPLAAEYTAMATRYPYPHCVAAEMLFRGWVMAEEGDPTGGIALIEQGAATLRAMGTLLFSAQALALLVEAYGRAHRFTEGVTLVDESLAFLATIDEHYWDAEFLRLKGEFLLAGHSVQEASEACYRQAIAVARRQGAKTLELRAAISLARLLQRQQQNARAHQLLADCYLWFTEGFDTADLQEARNLLAALAGSATADA